MSRPDETSTPSVEDTGLWSQAELTRDLTGKVLGDFHVERLLGRGGMGEVYLARQVSLNRPVALKVLRTDLLSKPTYLSRFEAEAAAVAKLNHPNIVHVYTLGSFEGVRFIAMEYVQGTNLREYIRRKGAIDYPLALSIMRQAGFAVSAAGEIGLVHRDIKPENLLLTRKGQVKIADFGLCRDLDDAARVELTQPGTTMGTPLYMSPEQAQGLPLDHRSDLYSLGVTFYQMLTGVPPFKAETALALALKHVKDVPVSMAVHRPDIPPDLDRLVLKLMAKAPKDRYQSATEMLRDLNRVREALNASSGPQPLAEITGISPPVTGRGPAGLTAATLAKTAPSGSQSSDLGTRFLPGRDTLPSLSLPARVGLVVLGLVAGLTAGWFGRHEDLLSERAAAPRIMPGLWMAPGWKLVEKKNRPEEQYRDAQMLAPLGTPEAVWLSVPGYHPTSREWSAKAYTQLARLLLRRGDFERLRDLADEIDHWEGAQTHEKELASIARAAVDALSGNVEGVLRDFDVKLFDPRSLTDPALMELCLEVTAQAERAAARPGSTANPSIVHQRFGGLKQELMFRLFQSEFVRPGAVRRPG